MGPVKKYSIILPVRNGGEYLKQCVQSILSQTYEDFNLHILDNCSNDGSREWIDSLNDGRVIVITSDNDLSIEESWGRIKSIRKNEFITLIGHDDLLYPDYLKTMDDLIGRYPEASLYQTHFNLINRGGLEIRKCKPMPEKETAADFLASVFQNQVDLFGTGYMMRSKDYDRLGGIPAYPNLLFADFELWTELTRRQYKVTSPKECFSYRIHQSTTKVSPDVKMQEAFAMFISYLKKLEEEDLQLRDVIRKNVVQFLYQYSKGLSHRLMRTPLGKRNGLSVKKFVRNCKDYADLLVPDNEFNPTSVASIKVALVIDSNTVTRNLFLWFKKLYPKPVLK
ncbi:MAG: glycosyltransferase [Flavisolibacter sp.]